MNRIFYPLIALMMIFSAMDLSPAGSMVAISTVVPTEQLTQPAPTATATPTGLPTQVPIPGENILAILRPGSYTVPDANGDPHFAGTVTNFMDGMGKPIQIWTMDVCRNVGCPTYLTVGGPDMLPIDGSICGYTMDRETNPNFDPTKPESLYENPKKVNRFFRKQDDSCESLSTPNPD